jgi:hypothetical protein
VPARWTRLDPPPDVLVSSLLQNLREAIASYRGRMFYEANDARRQSLLQVLYCLPACALVPAHPAAAPPTFLCASLPPCLSAPLTYCVH